MEILVVLVIVILICLILNISFDYILLGTIIVVGIMASAFAISFLYCFFLLVLSKQKEARFVRTGPSKNSKIQVAYYMVEGAEYPCMFPKEAILEDKLYKKDKIYLVMWNPRVGKVFDRYAITTCILGLIVSVVLSVGLFVLK